ncbi:energy transducer TonB family protein [Bartonella sp. A05]|uniref:energy transducer TonB family protein n=1 Tax=Bartonella sp. A05 TaxID=2967261 RepID=UPI0022A9891B|nr:energy transducer TonB [Bartonella sp. A05]MCZ2203825.1 TonB family protein [Bartonella sp. A05]
MNCTNIERLATLWIGAFVGAFSLHIALGALFYFQNAGVSGGTLAPVVMLTFAEEIIHPNVDTTLEEQQLEESQPEVLELEESKLEELESEEPELEKLQPEESHIVEKNDFIAPKPLKKSLPPKILPKPVAKQYKEKIARSSAVRSVENNALLAQWVAKVQEQLERQKNYVVDQRTSNVKGTVQLEFRVHEQGNIFAGRIALSSGDPELDRLAMEVLQRVGVFPPPPLSMVNKTIRVSLIFS